MLQVDVCPFASDALEDAMRLAQTKALNSYTFSDCLNFLNYVWADIYSQICMIDSGYYSRTVRLTSKLTKLPKFVRNSVMVYSAQAPDDGSTRRIFRQSGPTDYNARDSYQISGMDLLCPDAEHQRVWLEYCPQPSQIFFTHHNRDPKVFPDGHDTERSSLYNLYKLVGDRVLDVSDKTVTQAQIAAVQKWELVHRGNADNREDITEYLVREGDDENGNWVLKYVSCDFPYIFCSYENSITGEWRSGFFNNSWDWTDYNPFAFAGRNDNVEYIACHYNDKTGLGVIVKDHNHVETRILNTEHLPEMINSVIYVENYFEYKATDGVAYKFEQGYWYNRYATDFNYEKVLTEKPAQPDVNDVVLNPDGTLERYDGNNWQAVTNVIRIAQEETSPVVKELGWTPDTRLVYPGPEVYRYLVARLAEKFAALNESNIMGVQSELADAKFAFQAFLKRDKSAWERMRNVNLPTIGDYL